MSLLIRIGTAATMVVLLVCAEPAVARSASYPLTLCGPGLLHFCRIHGFFDSTPFRYNLAIYPGCIKWVRIETPHGMRRQRVLVCG